MGTPTFYYYPNRGRSLETVDLGEELQDLIAVPAIAREDAVALDGSMSTAVLGPRWELQIKLERFGSPGCAGSRETATRRGAGGATARPGAGTLTPRRAATPSPLGSRRLLWQVVMRLLARARRRPTSTKFAACRA